MRKIFTLILASVTSLALAQEKVNLSRSVDDNGRNLSIRVIGHVNGKFVDYDRTFTVEGLTKSDREALTDRVLDSLGVAKIEQPVAPLAPVPPTLPLKEYHSKGIVANSSHNLEPSPPFETNRSHDHASSEKNPLIKEVWLDENSFLHLRYSFTRCNEEFIFEKSTDASEKSESEREKFIQDFEREIELPAI